jgi:hypothetical protein
MHVITSDCAYQIIDQPWATQLFVNAASPSAVPEPSSLALLGVGVIGLIGWVRRRRTA